MIDWSQAPKWAAYAAMDSYGNWFFHEEKPHAGFNEWLTYGGRKERAHEHFDWKTTLTQRPKETEE